MFGYDMKTLYRTGYFVWFSSLIAAGFLAAM
jgi:hypothetical protein